MNPTSTGSTHCCGNGTPHWRANSRMDGRGSHASRPYLAGLEREGDMPAYDVTIKSAPALRVASLRDTVPHYPDIERLFGELCGFLGSQRLTFTGTLPPHARIRERELPAEPSLACTIHRGPYEGLHQAHTALLGWVEANGYRICGPDREIYLVGPESARNPAGYVTELQVPVSRG
jgi:effector-binding domain-containing protein